MLAIDRQGAFFRVPQRGVPVSSWSENSSIGARLGLCDVAHGGYMDQSCNKDRFIA